MKQRSKMNQQVKLSSGNSACTHTYDQAAFGKEMYADAVAKKCPGTLYATS
jgi:hypothetical protein